MKLSNNENKKLYDKIFTKRSIYYVDYWINIWTEINWNRPSIVIKKTSKTIWEDIIVIPLTSFKEDNLKDDFDIFRHN